MAQETELERLVVRLVGDGSSYLKMLQEAQAGHAQAKASVKEHDNALESLRGRVESLGAEMTKVFAAVGVAFEFKELIEGAEKWEESLVRMEAVLKANGRDVEATNDEYKKFIDTMYQSTRASKMEVRSLLESAETYGVTGATAEKAAKDAYAASKVVKDSSAEMLVGISQAIARGDYESAEHFKRMIRQLRGATDNAELVDKWNKIVAAGTEVMGKEMDTAAAKVDKAKQAMKLLEIEMGATLVELIKPSADWVKDQAEAFNHLSSTTRGTIAQAAAMTVAMIALNEVGGKVLVTIKALAANPLTWALAAAVAIGGIARAAVEADEATRKLKEALDDLEKGRRKEGKNREDATKDFLDEQGGNPDAVRKRIEAVQKELADLHKQEKEAQEAAEDATRSHYNPLEYIGRKFTEAMGGEFGRVPKERLKDINATIRQAQEELDKLNARTEETTRPGTEERSRKAVRELDKEIETIKYTKEELRDLQLVRDGVSEADIKLIHSREAARDQLKGEKEVMDTLKKSYADWEGQLAEIAAKDRGDLWFNKQLDELARKWPTMKATLDQAKARYADVQASIAAHDIKEGLRSPEEKLNDELTKLFDLLMRGKLSWDEYGKAAAAAREKIPGVAAALSDAVGAGTSNATKILYNQMQMLSGSDRPLLPAFVQKGPMPRVVGEDMGNGQGWGEGMGDPELPKQVKALVSTLQNAFNNGLRIGFVEAGA
jgi:hypothetical protein